MSYAPVKGAPPAINWHTPDSLMIDPAYQRSIQSHRSQTQIDQIAKGWDWRLCPPLMVSERPDGLYVIDGQHRTEAARRRGDIAHLPCCVSKYDSVAEEASLFVSANRVRQPAKRIHVFRALIAAGDEWAMKIDAMVRDAELTLAGQAEVNTGLKGAIFILRGIETALRKHGAAVTSAALVAFASIGRDQVSLRPTNLVQGLILLFASPPENFDPDRLEDTLKRYTVDEWSSHPDLPTVGEGRVTANAGSYLAMRKILIAEMADTSWDID